MYADKDGVSLDVYDLLGPGGVLSDQRGVHGLPNEKVQALRSRYRCQAEYFVCEKSSRAFEPWEFLAVAIPCGYGVAGFCGLAGAS